MLHLPCLRVGGGTGDLGEVDLNGFALVLFLVGRGGDLRELVDGLGSWEQLERRVV